MSSLTTQDRAAESERLIVERILPHLNGVKQGRAANHWTFYCPLSHRKKNASAAIWVDDDGWIGVHCFDCHRNSDLRTELVTPALIDRSPELPRLPSSTLVPQSPRPQRADPALHTWGRTESIPRGDHPARRWCSQRNLWRPEVEFPAPLRWLPSSRTYPGPHVGAGSIVALLAPPEAWTLAWPDLPKPQAVEIIAIDQDGNPSLDRPLDRGGLGKRTLGNKHGCFLVLGYSGPAPQDKPARVAEGVADMLALAARYSGPTVATMGDAGMKSEELAQWLSNLTAGAVIHADNDPPGREAANRLLLALKVLGSQARAVLPPEGKDPADAAALRPFPVLNETWTYLSTSLVDIYGWPHWEAQRQAAILMGDEQDQ